MRQEELKKLLDELRNLPVETEWKTLKKFLFDSFNLTVAIIRNESIT